MTTRTINHVDAEITPCGKPGHPGLPLGICAEHAIAVFRAVSKLVDIQAGQG